MKLTRNMKIAAVVGGVLAAAWWKARTPATHVNEPAPPGGDDVDVGGTVQVIDVTDGETHTGPGDVFHTDD